MPSAKSIRSISQLITGGHASRCLHPTPTEPSIVLAINQTSAPPSPAPWPGDVPFSVGQVPGRRGAVKWFVIKTLYLCLSLSVAPALASPTSASVGTFDTNTGASARSGRSNGHAKSTDPLKRPGQHGLSLAGQRINIISRFAIN